MVVPVYDICLNDSIGKVDKKANINYKSKISLILTLRNK